MLQKIKWFIHSDLNVGDLDRRLRLYTQCMNFILSKSTQNQLIYDGCEVVFLRPYNSIIYSDQPQPRADQFDIWVYLNHVPQKTNGYSTFHSDGTGVLDCDFDHLADPENPDQDFDNQIYVLLHEYAHNFGAGVGEYYRTAKLPDLTGIDPILDVDSIAPCRYWTKRIDFTYDFLLRNVSPWTNARFSTLTSAILNSKKYRIASSPVDIADPNSVLIQAYDANFNKLPNVRVDFYRDLRKSCEQYSTHTTNSNGECFMSWGSSIDDMSVDPMRLIKFYKNGYISGATHIALWDMQYAKVVLGKKNATISLFLLKSPNEMSGELMDKMTDLEESVGWSIYPNAEPAMFPKKFKRFKHNRLHLSNLDENLIQANILRCQKNH